MTRLAHSALAGLLCFGAISAIGGGVLGVVANGAGVPLEYLDGTPFTSYLIPGLILGVVIGGTQAVAAIATGQQRGYRLTAATIAALGMIIWIYVELAVTGYSWLQSVYLALAIAQLLLVLVLLGVLCPVPPVASARSSGPMPQRKVSHGQR